MEALEKRILQDGRLYDGGMLKVDSFLNHQIDASFLMLLADEVKRLFSDDKITKVLTVEASGIAFAFPIAVKFGVPLVFAKKGHTSNQSPDTYSSPVASFTHNCTYNISVAKEYLSSEDRVLIVDDFLALGNALVGLCDIISQAGATAVGAAIAVEKAFQGGGDLLRKSGLRVESLAKIASMDTEHGIVFSKD